MSDKKDDAKKPGIMKRLFSARKLSVNTGDLEAETKQNRMKRMHSVDGTQLNKCSELKEQKVKALQKQRSSESRKTSQQTKSGGKTSKRARRKKKDGRSRGEVEVNVDEPISWPVTPEIVLAYHKKKPLLNPNEEWLVVELNEYECLVENLDIIKIIAKHSKFFEVEPDELWDEFFVFMEEVPTYDEIINYDVWQEFRDEKYPY